MDHTLIPTYFSSEKSGESETLILVPGLDGTALLFYRQVPLLVKHCNVVTFPLPNTSDCTMNSLVADLKQLIEKAIERYGSNKVFLCGESFGGALSMSFALGHPELLEGLIIINSFPVIRDRFRLFVAPILLKAMPWAAMRVVRRFTESHLHSPHILSEDLREFHERMRYVSKSGYIRRLEILRSYDIQRQLSHIRTPTLFLAGDLDRLLPSMDEARFMAARVPHATVNILQGYGHICVINHDFSLLDYLIPWLQALPGSEVSR